MAEVGIRNESFCHDRKILFSMPTSNSKSFIPDVLHLNSEILMGEQISNIV